MPWVDIKQADPNVRMVACDGEWPRYMVKFDQSRVGVWLQTTQDTSWFDANLEHLPDAAVQYLFKTPMPGEPVRAGGTFAAEGAVALPLLEDEPHEGVEDLPQELLDFVMQAQGLGVRLGTYRLETGPMIEPTDANWRWLSYVDARMMSFHRLTERERYFWLTPQVAQYGQADVLRAVHEALEERQRLADEVTLENLPLEAAIGAAFNVGESLGTYRLEHEGRITGESSDPLGNNWTEPEYRRAVESSTERLLTLFERDFRHRQGAQHHQQAITTAIINEIRERRLEIARS